MRWNHFWDDDFKHCCTHSLDNTLFKTCSCPNIGIFFSKNWPDGTQVKQSQANRNRGLEMSSLELFHKLQYVVNTHPTILLLQMFFNRQDLLISKENFSISLLSAYRRTSSQYLSSIILFEDEGRRLPIFLPLCTGSLKFSLITLLNYSPVELISEAISFSFRIRLHWPRMSSSCTVAVVHEQVEFGADFDVLPHSKILQQKY